VTVPVEIGCDRCRTEGSRPRLPHDRGARPLTLSEPPRPAHARVRRRTMLRRVTDGQAAPTRTEPIVVGTRASLMSQHARSAGGGSHRRSRRPPGFGRHDCSCGTSVRHHAQPGVRTAPRLLRRPASTIRRRTRMARLTDQGQHSVRGRERPPRNVPASRPTHMTFRRATHAGEDQVHGHACIRPNREVRRSIRGTTRQLTLSVPGMAATLSRPYSEGIRSVP